MALLQVVLVGLGIVLSVAGGVVREAGSGCLVSDLHAVPGGPALLAHPLGAIVVGVVLLVAGLHASNSRAKARW